MSGIIKRLSFFLNKKKKKKIGEILKKNKKDMSGFYKIPLIIYFFMSTNEKLIYGWTMHLLQVGRYGKHGPDFETLINHHC